NLTGTLMTGPAGEPQVFDLASLGSPVDAIANADEPSHTVHRRLILPHVTPKAIASLETTLREWAIELIDPLVEAGGGDWVGRVANPLPTRAMALLVGLPLEDVDRLLVWAMAGTEVLAGTTTTERMGLAMAEAGQMAAYLAEKLRHAMAAPEDQPAPGVIGGLARGVSEGLISESDGASILVVLAGAGGESTSSLTGSAARILAEQPELQQQLRANPRLIPEFVEEVLRLESSFRGHYRHVKRDTRLGGVELPQGSRILLLWAAVNRDPEIFDNPDYIDIDRPGLREHLAFGRGTHFCVGARLARLEARVILEELLERTRSFQLDPLHPPSYVSSIFVRRHADLGLIVE
ncbi:MAG: cytochrome P450, partial [Deltaproteobacteria bacterium]|nr:cytochrome P450 [Deltaproteobacteria bacterium]